MRRPTRLSARCVAGLAAVLALLASAAIAQDEPAPAAGPFAKAAALAEQGKNQDALAEYAQIIKDHAKTDLTVATQARFAKAELLKKLKSRQEALNEYAEIVKENKGRDSDHAARALYEAGAYAASPNLPGTITDKNQALDTAYQLWRQLRDEYPDTASARRIAGFDGAMQQLMDRIDQRNARDWKYQIIDSLVRATGKRPAYSYALALILLAVIVKFLMLPLTKKQYASMREMQRMQPLVKELGKKFKGAELNQKTMELYKEHKVNPFAGCFTGILQVPFLILIFNAIREYEIAFAKGQFLWIGSPMAAGSMPVMGQPLLGLNLASPDVPLLALYVITNYVTMRMTPASDPQQQQQQNTMALFTSLLFFWMFLSYKWSSAFVLYWLALNILSIWQQYELIYKPTKLAAATGAGSVPIPPTGVASPSTTSGPSLTPTSNPTRVRPRRKKR
jgi:YidC/Oxa1 family membrane protein insertase